MIYLVAGHDCHFVISSNNELGAISAVEEIWRGFEAKAIDIEEAGDFANWLDSLKGVYDIKPIHRHEAMEWFERRLDGDDSIFIRL